jgi:hypothetical protein
MNATSYQKIETQLESLLAVLGIQGEYPRTLFHLLVREALQGPFGDGPRRFSAINADGVPFQWSVSIGSKPGGLRFLTDCGLPGTPISARIQHSREKLSQLSTVLSFSNALPALDRALDCLLPDTDLLDASLMGLWLAVGVAPNGNSGLKVYVNERVGDIATRYYRFAECLAAFKRHAALQYLSTLVQVIGLRAVPVASAFDVESTGIGRLKLYFRSSDGSPALLDAIARAVGCEGAEDRLTLLHEAFLVGTIYPPHAVVFSVEFPTDDSEISMKVDLNTGMFLPGDVEVDRRIQKLLRLLGLADDEYCAVRDVIAEELSSTRVAHLLFVGLALRPQEVRLNVYFHPHPNRK